jgi:translocation and assembly module TamA
MKGDHRTAGASGQRHSANFCALRADARRRARAALQLAAMVRRPARYAWLFASGGLLAAACADVPKGQYGIEAVRLQGVEQLAETPIERCLLSIERPSFGIALGLTQKQCNEPPFDSEPPRLELWSWPWSDWSGLNHAVVELDVQRIERFYRARGFYDARVVAVRYEPRAAGESEPRLGADDCDPAHEECEVELTFVIEEGSPLRVGEVRVTGGDELPPDAREALGQASVPQPGERFDELDYDRGKRELAEQLAEVGYAGAEIGGEVRLDHAHRRAHILYRVQPGPSYVFGELRITGAGELPLAPIRAAAGIEPGTRYRQSALTEVQQEVYALGAFSAVQVTRELDPAQRRAYLNVAVTPLPYDDFRVGVGVTSGAMRRTDSGEVTPVRQWDVHLFARYERRHVLGSLGRLRIEERPRLIFDAPFPETTPPKPGNVVSLRLTQPGLIEARTELVLSAQWDYGPDPHLGFRRSDIVLRSAATRGFFARALSATLALQQDFYLVKAGERIEFFSDMNGDGEADVLEVPRDYGFRFLEQNLTLDLRDDPVWPRAGAYFGLLASQSLQLPGSDWTAFRLLPEARGYLPLPFGIVLAGRFAVAGVFVLAADSRLDGTSQQLGPNAYRLRGGGAQSNRGFVADELGAGVEGGLRRWEGSAELRVRLGEAFAVVGFFDVGDVLRGTELSFAEPNPSAGGGLRYLTVVGAIRFDLGFRLGTVEADARSLLGAHGAMHLTLGEAF